MHPLPISEEHNRACDINVAKAPTAIWWRGDVRSSDGIIFPGANFNLIDDSNLNNQKLIGQFRVITMTAVPEGYIAIVAIASTAVASQIPTIRTSLVIKNKFSYPTGVKGKVS